MIPDGRVLGRTRDGRTLLFSTGPGARPVPFGVGSGALAVSLEGTVVAESTGSSITLRRVSDGALIGQIPPPADGAACAEPIALSASGAFLLAEGAEGKCVFDVATGKLTARLPPAWGAAAFRDDTEELVAIATFEGGIGLNVARTDTKGTVLGQVVIPRDSSMWLSPSGAVVATVAFVKDGMETCSLWSTRDGAELWSASTSAAASWTDGSPAFSPRGDLVALCGAVVRTTDGARVRSVISKATAEAQRYALFPWAWGAGLTPDGRFLLGFDSSLGGAALLEVESGKAVPLGAHTSGPPFSSVSVSRDGKVLAAAAGEIIVWNLAPRFEDSTAALVLGGRSDTPKVELAADAHVLSAAGAGRDLYDLATGGVISVPFLSPLSLPDDRNGCWPELRLSGDGRWLAGNEWDPVLHIRQATGLQATILDLPTGCARIAFSPDSRLLATSRAAVYRVEDGQLLVAGNDGTPGMLGAGRVGWSDTVEFSPDQTLFVVSSECAARDGASWTCDRIELHATSDGHLIRRLQTFMGRYPSFSPDGTWLVGGGALYHLPTGGWRDLGVGVRAATFTPEGDLIVGDAQANLTRYCRR